ncbi:hypothetical protein D3C76_1730210 [compost metagenome]
MQACGALQQNQILEACIPRCAIPVHAEDGAAIFLPHRQIVGQITARRILEQISQIQHVSPLYQVGTIEVGYGIESPFAAEDEGIASFPAY